MMRRNQLYLVPTIEVQFAATGIKLQKFRYTNALASLPKQVLRNILETVDICNESDQPFDHLKDKDVLFGQFGKSTWQSYFKLLRLPMECKASSPASHGKLKQHLPHGVSPDTDLFISMFLIQLLHSMREVVGAGNHNTAVAMVGAADAL
jgi:hypothetical protein